MEKLRNQNSEVKHREYGGPMKWTGNTEVMKAVNTPGINLPTFQLSVWLPCHS
jgi:hypothetical protein